MAKYHITHTCGHTCTHNIVGPERDRARKADWLRDRPCIECAKAETAAARAEEAASATVANAATGLVALIGSDKQVAWAETIRATAHAAVTAAAAGKTIDPAVASALNSLWAQDAARFWIDHRDLGDSGRSWAVLAIRLHAAVA